MAAETLQSKNTPESAGLMYNMNLLPLEKRITDTATRTPHLLAYDQHQKNLKDFRTLSF